MEGNGLRNRTNELRKPIKRRGKHQTEDVQPTCQDGLLPVSSPADGALGWETQESGVRESEPSGPARLTRQLHKLLEQEKMLRLGATSNGDEDNEEDSDTDTLSEADERRMLQLAYDRKQRKSSVQIEYVTKELVETEADYVDHLEEVVKGYMTELKDGPLPDGVQHIIFGNIWQIYEWHKRTVLVEIRRYIARPEYLARLFVRWKEKFSMYVKYCENKPKSEFLVGEHAAIFENLRKKMGRRLGIADLLITPIQRITKYQLLLKDLLRFSQMVGDDTVDLMRAEEVMKIVPKEANDMMSIARLEAFPGKILAQGRLLLQDSMKVMEPTTTKSSDQRFFERRVFLFEQSVIFAEQLDKTKNNHSNPRHIFKNYILTNNMGFHSRGTGEPYTFTIINRKGQSEGKFQMQAPNAVVYENWKTELTSLMDMMVRTTDVLSNPTK